MSIQMEEAKYLIVESNFDGYYSAIKEQFDNGTKRIELNGIGKLIPTVISLAQAFVEDGVAVWEKLNTDSIEGDNSSSGKKVSLKAIIKKKR